MCLGTMSPEDSPEGQGANEPIPSQAKPDGYRAKLKVRVRIIDFIKSGSRNGTP